MRLDLSRGSWLTSAGETTYFVNVSGSVMPVRVGYTNIDVATSDWTASDTRKSTSRRAAASCFVPLSTPAASIWR